MDFVTHKDFSAGQMLVGDSAVIFIIFIFIS